MAKQIISDILTVSNELKAVPSKLEDYLNSKYNEIIRWAIVDIGTDNNLKISITYEKEV